MINKIKDQYISSSLIKQHNLTTITCNGNFYSTDLDDDISPITPLSRNTFQYQSHMNYEHQSSPIIRTFDQFLATIPTYENICIKNFEIINNELLCECITHPKIILICTDGSYKQNSSGGATIITDEYENILVSGYNPDTGHEWFQCSYRSESQACLSGCIFLQTYFKYLHHPIPTSIYYCDNRGLIQKISSGLKITKQTTSQDIIKYLNHILPKQITAHHVYAH